MYISVNPKGVDLGITHESEYIRCPKRVNFFGSRLPCLWPRNAPRTHVRHGLAWRGIFPSEEIFWPLINCAEMEMRSGEKWQNRLWQRSQVNGSGCFSVVLACMPDGSSWSHPPHSSRLRIVRCGRVVIWALVLEVHDEGQRTTLTSDASPSNNTV